jgi:raffinose/stachyose/melibiose transport system permease protein
MYKTIFSFYMTYIKEYLKMLFKGISKERDKLVSYIILVTPACLIYLAILGVPIIASILLSFTDYNVYKNEVVWAGMKHFADMFTDPTFYLALKNNVYIILISVFGQIPLAFILAYFLFRKLVKKQDLFQTVIFMPAMISTIIVGVLWSAIMSPHGLISHLGQLITGKRFVFGMMADEHLAMIPILIVMLWMYTGTFMLIFLANLQRINVSTIESAQIDGASEGQILKHVILPSLSGVVVTTVILAVSGSLKSFDLIYAMTQGGPGNYTNVLSIYLYRKSFESFNYSFGSAVSTVLIVISFILIGLTLVARKYLIDDSVETRGK